MSSASNRFLRHLLALLLVGGCARGRLQENTSATDLRQVNCLGPVDAKLFAVYLHGMDSPSISDQELGNRQSLARAAEVLSMRIALPRASMSCPNLAGSVCWGWTFDEAESDISAHAIKDAAQLCFHNQPFGLIGFSNGGYLISKLFRTCTLHEKVSNSTWAVIFGSAAYKGPLKPQPASLAGCGRLVIVSGTEDTYNSDPTDHLLNLLKAKGADVTSIWFEGGHLVPEKPLQQAIELAAQAFVGPMD